MDYESFKRMPLEQRVKEIDEYIQTIEDNSDELIKIIIDESQYPSIRLPSCIESG